jgi:hypothetical protein
VKSRLLHRRGGQLDMVHDIRRCRSLAGHRLGCNWRAISR